MRWEGGRRREREGRKGGGGYRGYILTSTMKIDRITREKT